MFFRCIAKTAIVSAIWLRYSAAAGKGTVYVTWLFGTHGAIRDRWLLDSSRLVRSLPAIFVPWTTRDATGHVRNLIDSDYMSYHSYRDPADPSDEIFFRVFAVVLAGLFTVVWMRRRQLLQNSEIKVFSQHCEIVALPAIFVFMPLRSISLTGHQIQTMRSTRSGRFTIRTSDGHTVRFFATDEHSCIEALNAMMTACYNAKTTRPE